MSDVSYGSFGSLQWVFPEVFHRILSRRISGKMVIHPRISNFHASLTKARNVNNQTFITQVGTTGCGRVSNQTSTSSFDIDEVGAWSHDLCSCFDDVSTCLSTLFCPCIMFGRTAEKIGSGNCVLCGASLMLPPINFISRLIVRGRIRESKGIDGSSVNDCLLIFFCPFCSLVQEVQECQDVSPSAQSMCRN